MKTITRLTQAIDQSIINHHPSKNKINITIKKNLKYSQLSSLINNFSSYICILILPSEKKVACLTNVCQFSFGLISWITQGLTKH